MVALATAPLLAGCLALPDGGGPPSGGREVAIVDRDPLPALPVWPSVDVVDPAATADGPPTLRATVENAADYPVEVGEERAIVFAYVASDGRPGLTLLPAVDDGYEAVEPGCWRLAEPVAVAGYYGVVRLAPGEAVDRRLEVWGSADGDGCLPTGRFHLSTAFAGARDRREGLDEQAWQGTWGFTLEVS